ncbi:MAG: hypothetical protein CBD76_03885 [Pelagibacteraceae bacterium TMED216]|nr:MAG: hypothetical protein CBD76_03885 [Pelagibacteraceae bacterium TMED216]
MVKKILHLEKNRYSEDALNNLGKSHELIFKDFNLQEDFDSFLETNQFDVIFTRLGLFLGKSQIVNQKNLKCIVTPTTGYNHIDVEYAQKYDIKIIGLQGEVDFLKHVKSTAEHTWALLLSISKNLYPSINSVKKINTWDRNLFLSDELDKKTLGIIGFGRLGRIVSQYANAFGMKILANDIDNEAFKNAPSYINICELTGLLKSSDYIILLISWKQENHRFINSDKLAKFKKGAYLINTSRGEFIDEKALINSLKYGKIKGAALDVLNNDSTWNKSTKIKNDLIEYSKTNNNLIITPHIGGYGKESVKRTREFVTNLFLKEYL